MAEENADQAPQQQFIIQKVYLKDVSFETPNSPAVFMEEWDPAMNVDLNSEGTRLEEGVFEVVLTTTVTVKVKEKTAFLVEVKQAGVFTIQGFGEPELGHMLGAYCPTILFPYAREAISDLVAKGGFPQLVLAPVNFDALYMQEMQRRQQAQQ